MKFEIDETEARKKLSKLEGLGHAYQYNLTKWGAETLRHIRDRIRGDLLKPRSGNLTRNTNMKISGSKNLSTLVLGTGIPPGKSVPYADIQENGGTTHPQVTPKMRRWAWAMFMIMGDDKFKGIALTKKSRLSIPIPASGWFSISIKEMTPLLDMFLSPSEILNTLGVLKER